MAVREVLQLGDPALKAANKEITDVHSKKLTK